MAIAWTAHVLTDSLPYWPINPSISTDPWFTMQLDMVRCLWAVLPAAILWGASFPLALASVAARGQDPARLVGGVYAANTLGAIVGSLGASLVLVAWIGSQHAQQVLIVFSMIAGLLLLEPAARKRGGQGSAIADSWNDLRRCRDCRRGAPHPHGARGSGLAHCVRAATPRLAQVRLTRLSTRAKG